VEKIVELEKEYDFNRVPLVYRDQAKKWLGLTVPLLRASDDALTMTSTVPW